MKLLNMHYNKKIVLLELVGFNKPKLSNEDVKNIQRKRKSDLVWFNDTWIYKVIHPYVHEANRNAGWNFAL